MPPRLPAIDSAGTPPVWPAPAVTAETAFFWEAAREGRLVAQRCSACGMLRHPPRPACGTCGAFATDIVDLSGTGVVYSAVAVHYPQHPMFTYPHLAGLVDLDDGVRLAVAFRASDLSAVEIGTRVVVDFVPAADGWCIPVFGVAP